MLRRIRGNWRIRMDPVPSPSIISLDNRTVIGYYAKGVPMPVRLWAGQDTRGIPGPIFRLVARPAEQIGIDGTHVPSQTPPKLQDDFLSPVGLSVQS